MLASDDFHALVIASVYNNRQRLDTDLFTRLICHIAELRSVIANVGDFMGDDQVVFVIDCCLYVVANCSCALTSRGH